MSQNNTTGVGFMYFNPTSGISSSVADTSSPSTSDFLTFTDAAQNPTNYAECSNQLPRYRPTSNQNKWKNNRKSFNNSNRGRKFNNSFNSSYTSHNNSSFGDNSSFNDSGDYSSVGYNTSFDKREKFNQSRSGRKSLLHPSFMEDPWAELIKQAEMKKLQQKATDDSSN